MSTKDFSGMMVQKRNGQVVPFNPERILHAVGNAFKQSHSLPREADLPAESAVQARAVAEKVDAILKARTSGGAALNVEEIQDEVIRQLYENGHATAAKLYADYRREHAQRRTVFELYKTVKRDGRVVAFKPEKITMAVAAALRAQHQNQLSDQLLEKAKSVTDGVIVRIREQWPQGKAITIEEIQDLVEKELFVSGLETTAYRYRDYRQERARLRTQPEVNLEVSLEWVKKIHVVNARGERHPVDLTELRRNIGNCCAGLKYVSADKILQEAVKNYCDGITEDQVNAANIMAAKGFLEQEPEYTFVAARLLLLQHYRETIDPKINFQGIAAEYPRYFVGYIRKAVDLELLSPDLLGFDLDFLARHLDPQRDFLFRYMGLQTLYDRYFIHQEGRRLELPQVFWMRVAMGLALKEGQDKNQRAVEFYNLISTFDYMPSTPTLFNSGTGHAQLSSCFLTMIDDDLQHIFKCIQDDAMLSKWSGGLGNDWTNVRALGSWIKGTNGRSQGIIPFLKVANDTAIAVNQGGKRQGAMCAYLETWHMDIEEFLDLRKNTGDDRRRTHDMHTANWIPDLFMKRVKENGEWTLFSPNDVRDLHHTFGKDFENRYTAYEALARAGKIKQFKIVPAVQLWRRMLGMLFETGHPWITWKDPSNVRSPQSHVGVVHSSNLCTEILLNTSRDETAVCNLGSINLAAHATPNGLNIAKLEKTVRTALRILDNVIDINFYPTVEAQNANQRHRPVGLGIMGFQDALFIRNLSYASAEAVEFADESMEAVSYCAILASSQLAREKGAYSTYKGSKWDQGYLPLDTISLLEQERGGHLDMDRSSRMDWTPVRKSIKANGMRNSLVMAIAPTATIANIVGVTSSIEPLYKNMFVKSNLSGEFTVLNEYLVEDLKKAGLWDREMIDDLKYFDGSIQEIERVPAALKRKYATAFEVEYEWLIEAASRRQKWIDMGQSLNLYQAQPSGQKVSDMYLFGWEKGLKTTYYLRSMGATRIEKSTLDVTKAKYVGNIVGRRQRDDDGKVLNAAKAEGAVCSITGESADGCEACQ